MTRRARDDDVVVPNHLDQWRSFRGIESQSELARRAGLESNVISRLESGKLAYTFHTLKKLAPVLGCTMGEIISVDPFEQERMIQFFYARTYAQ